MYIVFDTNVLISTFLWQKKLKPIYTAIRTNNITPCFSPKTWAEFVRALNYNKFRKQLQKIAITPEEITSLLISRAYFVAPRVKIKEIKEDPSDNHILACAISCDAFCIVSGNKHLLKLKEFQGIAILTPRQFLKHLNK